MAALSGKIAVITGSDSGMGRAMAEEFARAGADLALTYHSDVDGAQESRRKVEAAGRRALVRQVDVREEANSLALELASLRINVNAVAPGLIRTPMTAERTEDPQAMEEELPDIPLRRPGEPWEVGRLACYFVSDDADYITGQSFTIDGGLEMNWGQGA